MAGWRNDRCVLTAAWQSHPRPRPRPPRPSSDCVVFSLLRSLALLLLLLLLLVFFYVSVVVVVVVCKIFGYVSLIQQLVCSNCFEEVCVLNGLIDHTLHSSLAGALVLQSLLLLCAILSVVFLAPAAVFQGVAHPPGTVFLSLYALLKFESPNFQRRLLFLALFCLLQTASLIHLLLPW